MGPVQAMITSPHEDNAVHLRNVLRNEVGKKGGNYGRLDAYVVGPNFAYEMERGEAFQCPEGALPK